VPPPLVPFAGCDRKAMPPSPAKPFSIPASPAKPSPFKERVDAATEAVVQKNWNQRQVRSTNSSRALHALYCSPHPRPASVQRQHPLLLAAAAACCAIRLMPRCVQLLCCYGVSDHVSALLLCTNKPLRSSKGEVFWLAFLLECCVLPAGAASLVKSAILAFCEPMPALPPLPLCFLSCRQRWASSLLPRRRQWALQELWRQTSRPQQQMQQLCRATAAAVALLVSRMVWCSQPTACGATAVSAVQHVVS
jgi:hypothetical protein